MMQTNQHLDYILNDQVTSNGEQEFKYSFPNVGIYQPFIIQHYAGAA